MKLKKAAENTLQSAKYLVEIHFPGGRVVTTKQPDLTTVGFLMFEAFEANAETVVVVNL